MARQLGYLDIPTGLLVDIGEANRLAPDEIVIMTTGAQGEPAAGLGRLSVGTHRQLEIEDGDTIVLSSHPIPGNEEMVHRTINRLIQRGAEVIYDPIAAVHVSGHAAQEEMKLLISLVKPRFFVPVHGELRQLHMHRQLAEGLGIARENIAIVENGIPLEFTADSMTVGERVPGGYVFVDGAVVGDVGPAVLRDREMLGRDGFLMVNVSLDADTHELLAVPEFVSRGVVYVPEAGELLGGAQNAIRKVIYNNGTSPMKELRGNIEGSLERYFYDETKRRPMVFAVIHDVTR